MPNAPREHSAILSTYIKLPFVVKTFVLSIFQWPLQTGFTVFNIYLTPYKLPFVVKTFVLSIFSVHFTQVLLYSSSLQQMISLYLYKGITCSLCPAYLHNSSSEYRQHYHQYIHSGYSHQSPGTHHHGCMSCYLGYKIYNLKLKKANLITN